MMMNRPNVINDEERMNRAFPSMNMDLQHYRSQSSGFDRKCSICASKAIGMNFGVLTCAPCKAFFRRNARRKELLELPCGHRDWILSMRNNRDTHERTIRYLQVRRCSSCRLRRCFEMGMKEELVRTDEENERHRQIIDINRQQRQILKQQLQQIKQLSIPQNIVYNNQLSNDIDWRHLSNIVYAYDTYCLKTFTQQRTTIICNEPMSISNEQTINKNPTNLPMTVVLSIGLFVRSLPAFYSLPRTTRTYLCKTNIRPIIFPNVHELNQSCFSEPWQVTSDKATWKSICGSELYKQFDQAERLAEKLIITDPVITRLFIIVLFFSTPLHYHYNCPTPTPILKKKLPVRQAQNAYATLLWKYILHRHGDMEAVRIYSNLIHVYLKMQRVGFGMHTQLRTQKELISTHETLNKLVTLNINDIL